MREHHVPRAVAVGVVDALEPVDVDHRRRQGRPVAVRARDLLAHPHPEELVVVALGEPVADRHLAQRGQPVQVRAHPGHQLLRLERLGDVVVSPDLEAADTLLQLPLPGDEDDRRELERRVLSHPAAELEAVDRGHHHVHHDQVGQLRLDHRQRPLRVAGVRADEAGASEHAVDQLGAQAIVVDHQHLRQLAPHAERVRHRDPLKGCLRSFERPLRGTAAVSIQRRGHPGQGTGDEMGRLAGVGELAGGDQAGQSLRDRGEVSEQGQLDHLGGSGDAMEEGGEGIGRGAIARVAQVAVLRLPGLAVALGQLAEEEQADLEQVGVAEIVLRFQAAGVSHGRGRRRRTADRPFWRSEGDNDRLERAARDVADEHPQADRLRVAERIRSGRPPSRITVVRRPGQMGVRSRSPARASAPRRARDGRR